jgi:uncharacterized integral membrane protein
VADSTAETHPLGCRYRLKIVGQLVQRVAVGEAGGVVSQEGTEQPAGRQLGGGAIASLTGVGVLVIVMIQNTEDVTLDFLFWSFTWPLWLFTVVTALFGALAWFGFGVMRRHRRRKERRDDRRG